MTRLRLALLALAAAIALLVAALVSRALDSAEVERRMRHQAVAHRAFDEMERVLSSWLEREESRPFGDYRFYRAASGPSGPERSALSFPPAAPFVLGAFQVDPDGSLHTPLEPRDPAAASARGDWPPSEAVRKRIERVGALAAVLPGHARRLRVVPESAPPPVEQRAGVRSPGSVDDLAQEATSAITESKSPTEEARTQAGAMADGSLARARAAAPLQADRALESEWGVVGEPASVKTKKEREREKSDPGDDPEQAYSAYAALEKLNLASNQRAERRRQTIQVEKRSELPPAPSAPRIESAGAPLEDEGFSPESGGELTAVPVHTADDEVARDADRLAQGARPVPRKDERPAPGDADRAEADLAPPRTAAARMALGDSGRARLPEAASVEARRAPFADAVLEGQVEDDSVRIAIDPMTGVALLTPEPMLALYRSVIVGAQGYRQGLIIDLDALGAMLEADVIRAGGLDDIARVRFAVIAAPMPPAAGPGYSFVHRFAEPFDALSVRLDLQPLGGDADERQTLLALAGLVMVLTFGGLFAVDRMTAVVIDFAERRGNFVAAVSHELKTPLTSIRMYAEMLRDGLVGSEAKRVEYLATIGDESERLSRLIDNVLEFSRLEKGRAELALVAGDVAGPVQEAVQRLGPFAEREGFALRVEVEPDLPPVLFERDALMQVVFNLIDNAIKYATSATRRDIIVRVARAGDGVEVTVRDFGPGVARAALRRVFEPFHRGESELTRAAKGTGIGLALVAELSAAMKARVVGESPEDGGFLVRVTFAHR